MRAPYNDNWDKETKEAYALNGYANKMLERYASKGFPYTGILEEAALECREMFKSLGPQGEQYFHFEFPDHSMLFYKRFFPGENESWGVA